MPDFPTALSELEDNVDDVMSKHVNNLEIKVGIDNSEDVNSLDYKIKRAANVLVVQAFS